MCKKATFLLICIIFLMSFVKAQEPTRWRGEGSTGIYNETGLLKLWPASGPEIIWQISGLGEGHSSPVFANDKIYLSGTIGGIGQIFALSFDGKVLWKVPYGEEWIENYPGSRSSPVVDGDLLYIYSGRGVVTCLDASNGKFKWRKDVIKELGGKNIVWGVNETLVVDGDKLFVTPGGPVNNIVALNRLNGNLIWSCKAEGEQSAYCTPLLVKLPSRKLLVTMTEKHIVGVDAEIGQFLWSQEQINQYSVHANTPLYFDNSLFCFSGYGQGSVKLDLNEDGSKITKAWVNKKMDSRIGGAVLVNGFIYGSGDQNRQWQCIDWKTGEQKYESKAIGAGNVIYADDLFYCYSDRGDLALVEAKPEGFNVISKTKLVLGSAQHWAHLVINNGRLYLRHDDTLIAYKIK